MELRGDYLLLAKFLNSCESIIEKEPENLPYQEHNITDKMHIIEQMGNLSLNLVISGRIAALAISLVNLILNTVCLKIFLKWQMRPMILLLVFLSASEIALNFAWLGIFFTYTFLIYPNEKFPNLNPQIGFVLYGFILPLFNFLANSSIIIRNWTVVLIALARFEAIKYPLKPKKFCEGKSLNIMFFVIMLISILYGIVRIFEYTVVVCSENYKIIMHKDLLLANSYYHRIVWNVGFCGLQGLGPVLCAIGLYFGLVVEIHGGLGNIFKKKNEFSPLFVESIHGKSHTKSKASELFKNRTVLFLCMMFFIFEAPQCILSILGTFEIIQVKLFKMFLNLTTILLLMDSTSNFWIYMASNEKFRQSLLEVFCCCITRKYSSVRKFSMPTRSSELRRESITSKISEIKHEPISKKSSKALRT